MYLVETDLLILTTSTRRIFCLHSFWFVRNVAIHRSVRFHAFPPSLPPFLGGGVLLFILFFVVLLCLFLCFGLVWFGGLGWGGFGGEGEGGGGGGGGGQGGLFLFVAVVVGWVVWVGWFACLFLKQRAAEYNILQSLLCGCIISTS